jgi:hypothetical protein
MAASIKGGNVMGTKYCPNCKRVVISKAVGNYSQVDFKGILVKRRKIKHLEEDGGCGHEWYTVEIPEDVLKK